MRCPWKINWGTGHESAVQCGKDEHLSLASYDQRHEGQHPNSAASGGFTKITWLAGDRREYTGNWPGPCPHLAMKTAHRAVPCTLHEGHHGRCAP